MSQEPGSSGDPPSPRPVVPRPPERVPSRRRTARLVAKRAVQFTWLLALLNFIGAAASPEISPTQLLFMGAGALCALLAIVLTATYWLQSRVRLTVRRMMIAVAVVATLLGVGIGLMRRSERFLMISFYHDWTAGWESSAGRRRWHQFMHQKYDFYRRHPWLRIPSDPPEPE